MDTERIHQIESELQTLSRKRKELLEELKALLSRFPGTASLRLHLGVAPGARVTIDASPGMTVTPNESLKQEVEALLGPGTVNVV